MTTPIRHTALLTSVAIAACITCAAPALAQNAAPNAARAANTNDLATLTPTDRVAKNRSNELALLGAPRDYGGDDTPQRNLGDAQRTAILDEQRITLNAGGQQGEQGAPAAAKAQRKAPGAANGAVRVAGQPGRPNAAGGLTPDGATKNAYADPYASKRSVYRSPW